MKKKKKITKQDLEIRSLLKRNQKLEKRLVDACVLSMLNQFFIRKTNPELVDQIDETFKSKIHPLVCDECECDECEEE